MRFLLSLLLFALLALPVLAGDPSGNWISSSGNSIHVWCNMEQVIITVRNRAGQVSKYNGNWTQFGETFSYFIPGSGQANCVIQGPNQISVQSASGPTVWTRGGAAPRQQTYQPPPQQTYQPPPPQNNVPSGYIPVYPAERRAPVQQQQPMGGGAGLAGVYQSTSGNTFQLTSRDMQIFIVEITNSGQRLEGSGRWLQYPSRFEYCIPAASSAWMTATALDGNSWQIQGNGVNNRWTRMR